MYPVSPELQRVASHQCALLRSRMRKDSPAGKRSAFRSAELKANRERYIIKTAVSAALTRPSRVNGALRGELQTRDAQSLYVQIMCTRESVNRSPCPVNTTPGSRTASHAPSRKNNRAQRLFG